MLVRVKNRTLIINIDTEIGGYFGITDGELKRELQAVEGQYDGKAKMSINSRGGSVTTGMAIRSEILNLVESGVEVEVEVAGVAASIASVIAMAGTSLKMRTGSYIMIHRPKAGKMVDYEEAQSLSETLRKMNEDLISIYEDGSNLERDVIAEQMRLETWKTAEEAMADGFVQTIVIEEEAVNSAIFYDKEDDIWNSYTNVPDEIKNSLSKQQQQQQKQKPKPKPNSTEETFMNLTEAYAKHPELETEVKNLLSDDGDKRVSEAKAEETSRITALLTLTGGQMTPEVENAIKNGDSEADLALALVKEGKVPTQPQTPETPVNTGILPTVHPQDGIVPDADVAKAKAEEEKFENLMGSIFPSKGDK